MGITIHRINLIDNYYYLIKIEFNCGDDSNNRLPFVSLHTPTIRAMNLEMCSDQAYAINHRTKNFH